MSDENYKGYVVGLSFIGTLLFLVLCNVYQPNAAIATLTLTTIFMSLIWMVLLELIIVIVLVVVLVIAGVLFA